VPSFHAKNTNADLCYHAKEAASATGDDKGKFERDLSSAYNPKASQMSSGQVVYLVTPDSTAVVKGSSTSDVLLLLKTELLMVTEVEDEG
jgi:hypothetical protein